jgi:DNA replication protein DnaC
VDLTESKTFQQAAALSFGKPIDETCEKCGIAKVELMAIGKIICPECAKEAVRTQESELQDKWSLEAWKAHAWRYFREYSVLKQEEIKQAGFKNYDTSEEQVLKAKNKAKSFIQEVLSGGNPHMILSGAPGRGKSHLAMATERAVIEMSKYSKKGIFVHYSAFLKLKQKSFDDRSLKLKVAAIEDEMARCEVLVLDDLGVDLGSIENPKEATAWNMDTLNQITEAREHKPLIVTTNFDEGQIRSCYGERNYSRIFSHSKGYRIEFNNVTDKRLQ